MNTTEIKSIKKPKAQKKKWYFPNGVWIMIKEYMNITNSKFMNKILEPLSSTEKSLSTKIKNVIKLCDEYPKLFRIVEAYDRIKHQDCDNTFLDCLASSYEIRNYAYEEGIENLKILMKCLPQLKNIKYQRYEEYQGKPFLQEIKDRYLDEEIYSDEKKSRLRTQDEEWCDL